MEKLYKHPVLVAGIIAALTIFFAAQLPNIRLDNNNMRFLPDKNQARIISEYIDDEFGGQVIIYVGLERPYSTIFDPGFLEKVRYFSETVEELEFVKDVNSIMSTKYITGNSDSIIVDDLVPQDFSGTPAEIAELKRRIASWDLFQGAIVSNDHQATQLMITLNVTTKEQTSPEVNATLFTVRKLAHETFAGLCNVYVTGPPVINATINEAMIADNIVLIPLVVIALLTVLFFSFRRFTFVMLPMTTVIVAVVWTTGIMILAGMQFSILTTLLPVILVAVGSAYGIHVVTHYMIDYSGRRAFSVDEHRVLVFELMRKMIRPVFLTALTTFAGFISFCFTPIVPMLEFGIAAGIGVIASFAVAVILIPCLLLIRGPRPVKTLAVQAGALSGRISDFLLAVMRKKALILFITVLVVALSVYGLSKVIVDNVLVEFFQNETDISRSDRFIRERFGGSKELTIVVQADTTEEALSPEVLSAVDNLSRFLSEQVPEVGKVLGFTDIIKRVNQVFNVDESPEGLAAGRTAVQNAAANAGSFGFGFDDNFGDFGSGFGGDAIVEEEYAPSFRIPDYSAADLIALLDRASANSANMSGSDLVRELKRLVNHDGYSYYEIPSEPARYGKTTSEELQLLVANYLVFIAGDDSMVYANDPLEPTALKTTIQLRTAGNRDSLAVLERIKAYIGANFPKNVRVLIGGGAMQEAAITELIVNSQIISIAISVLIVFIIIAISNRSLAAGLIGTIPILIAILCNFAVMGFLGIKLNIGTALIASLTVGIGIDYTIHFIDSFKREYLSAKREYLSAVQKIGDDFLSQSFKYQYLSAVQKNGDDFLRQSFISCGKAIITNAVSVGAGFGILAFSQFRIVAAMGLLIALSMLITALVSLTIIPALLTTMKPQFIYGKNV